MANISEKLKAELGYSPLVDSVLLQFNMEILLAPPYTAAAVGRCFFHLRLCPRHAPLRRPGD